MELEKLLEKGESLREQMNDRTLELWVRTRFMWKRYYVEEIPRKTFLLETAPHLFCCDTYSQQRAVGDTETSPHEGWNSRRHREEQLE